MFHIVEWSTDKIAPNVRHHEGEGERHKAAHGGEVLVVHFAQLFTAFRVPNFNAEILLLTVLRNQLAVSLTFAVDHQFTMVPRLRIFEQVHAELRW